MATAANLQLVELLTLRLQSDRRWLKSPDRELDPFSNFRSFSNSGFLGHLETCDFMWQYTTNRSEFKTTVYFSGNANSVVRVSLDAIILDATVAFVHLRPQFR